MKEVSLNLTATEEGQEDFYEFGVEIEIENTTNTHGLIHNILREGIKAMEKKGIKIENKMFCSHG